MKQLKVLSLAALALITLRSDSCGSKSASHLSMGTWHLSGAAHTAKTISISGAGITGAAADGINNASVFVRAIPNSAPDAGITYKIVGYEKMGQLADNECIVQVMSSATDMYVSTANNAATMNLKIDDDRVTVVVPAVWATHYVSYAAQSDSAKIDATLAQ